MSPKALKTASVTSSHALTQLVASAPTSTPNPRGSSQGHDAATSHDQTADTQPTCPQAHSRGSTCAVRRAYVRSRMFPRKACNIFAPTLGPILPIVAPVDPSQGGENDDWAVNSLRHQRNRVFFAALSLLLAVTQVTGSRGITKVGRDTGLLAPGSWSIPLPRLQKEQA
jgi:hypothetical protein